MPPSEGLFLRFPDRAEAGRRLGLEVRRSLTGGKSRVYGLARGGVIVGRAVAETLNAPLEVMAVAKISAPGEPELALGAVAEGDGVHWEETALAEFGVPAGWREQALEQARHELERRRMAYRGGPLEPVDGEETAILVDDGLATGSTMLAAVDGLRRLGARRVLVAVPVASREGALACARHADQVVAVQIPAGFGAVGAYYRHFEPLSDEEVRRHLHAGRLAGG